MTSARAAAVGARAKGKENRVHTCRSLPIKKPQAAFCKIVLLVRTSLYFAPEKSKRFFIYLLFVLTYHSLQDSAFGVYIFVFRVGKNASKFFRNRLGFYSDEYDSSPKFTSCKVNYGGFVWEQLLQ
jgi:hypothetical protein